MIFQAQHILDDHFTNPWVSNHPGWTDTVIRGIERVLLAVIDEEPLPQDPPIRHVKHAVLSSHRAGAIGESIMNIGHLVADDVEALSRGLAPWAMQLTQPEFIRLRG